MIWYCKHIFEFGGGKDEAVARLRSTLSAENWNKLVPTFSDGQIKIFHKLPPLFYNSWNPIFVGEFVRSATGIRLIGHFRVHWLVLAFILAFLGLCLFQLYDAWSQPMVVPGKVANWRDKEITFQLQFMGFFVLINILGWALGIPYQRRILAAIRESATRRD